MADLEIAVITGSAQGLGLALAKTCIQRGMHVVMADIDKEALQKAAQTLDHAVSPMVCDVTQRQEVENLAHDTFDRFKRVDLLINNAGIMGEIKPVWELDSQTLKTVIDVNVHGVLHGIQAFVPHLLTQTHRSHIANMASLFGFLSSSQLASYALSKHAIVALTESLYFDLKRVDAPIDVSVICPSFANTDLLDHAPIHPTRSSHALQQLMSYGRDPMDVAVDMMRELDNKTFYILPDKEIKNECEAKIKAVLEQTPPHEHCFEKLIKSIMARQS